MIHATIPTAAIVEDNYRQDFDPDALRQLAATIGRDGLLQLPIVEDSGDGTYLLCDGNRRLIACRDILGWHEIPAMVAQPGEIEDRETAQYIANAQGVATSPLEDGDRFLQWQTRRGWNAATIAGRIGKTVPYVERRLAVAQCSEQTREALRCGLISLTLAAELSHLDQNRQRLALGYAMRDDVRQSDLVAYLAKLAQDQGDEAQAGFTFTIEEWHAETVAQREREESNASSMPMGRAEIADYLGVKVPTVSQWAQRGILPAPDGRISGNPVWLPATVHAWALESGRVTA